MRVDIFTSSITKACQLIGILYTLNTYRSDNDKVFSQIKLSLFLRPTPRKFMVGIQAEFHQSLTLSPDIGGWPRSLRRHLAPAEHWVGDKNFREAEDDKNLSPGANLNTGHPATNQLLFRLSYPD
jgi:hypothetical protein